MLNLVIMEQTQVESKEIISETLWKEKLLPYQIPHAENLIYTLQAHGRALDLSQTGTGKSYVACAIAKQLNLKPFIVCPKSLVTMWPKVLDTFGLKSYGITNYELLQQEKFLVKGIPKKCPYIECKETWDQDIIENDYQSKRKDSESKFYTFVWKDLPKDILFIFDEAHRCKNPRTYNGILLHSLAETESKILLLSATLADKPDTFVLPTYVLKLVKNVRDAKDWINRLGKEYENVMSGVHDIIFPEYASRMRSRDVKDLFPDNKVVADCYEMENSKEIEEQYQIIEEAVKSLGAKEEASDCALAKILYARMKIEQLKIPTFVKMTKENLDNGCSVAIFVNFTETLKTLKQELGCSCVIFGKQTTAERDRSIRLFNEDKERIIICNIRSGGVGISLHDTKADYPRISLISPSWSAQDILQVLGRIHRANGKTPVVQKILFCQGTVEERISESMKEKIVNIAQLNDGDLLSHEIEGLTKDDSTKEEISEIGKMFLRMETLQARKNRLQEELKEVDKEMKELQDTIQLFIQ